MAKSYVDYTADGSTTQFNLPFGYIDKSHVTVIVAGVSVSFTWVNDSRVQLSATPADGDAVRIARTTPTTPLTVYQPASTLKGADLTRALTQSLYLAEENEDATGGTADTVAAEAAAVALAAAASAAADLWTRPVSAVSNTPDVTPSIGMRRLIGTTPTGAWAAHPDEVAEYYVDGWHFSGAPQNGQALNVGRIGWMYAGSEWKRAPEEVTPEMFGAACDGTTDDTAAIQATIDYALTSGRKIVCATGTYKITDTITASLDRVPNGGKNLYMRGQGMSFGYGGTGGTTFKFYPADKTSPAFLFTSNDSVDGYNRFIGRDFTVYGGNTNCYAADSSGAFGISGIGVALDLNRVGAHYMFAGVATKKFDLNRIANCELTFNQIGLLLGSLVDTENVMAAEGYYTNNNCSNNRSDYLGRSTQPLSGTGIMVVGADDTITHQHFRGNNTNGCPIGFDLQAGNSVTITRHYTEANFNSTNDGTSGGTPIAPFTAMRIGGGNRTPSNIEIEGTHLQAMDIYIDRALGVEIDAYNGHIYTTSNSFSVVPNGISGPNVSAFDCSPANISQGNTALSANFARDGLLINSGALGIAFAPCINQAFGSGSGSTTSLSMVSSNSNEPPGKSCLRWTISAIAGAPCRLFWPTSLGSLNLKAGARIFWQLRYKIAGGAGNFDYQILGKGYASDGTLQDYQAINGGVNSAANTAGAWASLNGDFIVPANFTGRLTDLVFDLQSFGNITCDFSYCYVGPNPYDSSVIPSAGVATAQVLVNSTAPYVISNVGVNEWNFQCQIIGDDAGTYSAWPAQNGSNVEIRTDKTTNLTVAVTAVPVAAVVGGHGL